MGSPAVSNLRIHANLAMIFSKIAMLYKEDPS